MRLLNRPNRSDETFDIHLTGFLEETASAPCATSLRKYAATDHGSASSTTERDTRRAMSQGDGEAEDGLLLDARAAARFSMCILRHLEQELRGPGKRLQCFEGGGRCRLLVALALGVGVMLATLAAPAGAAESDPDAIGRAGKETLRLWAYFDGDTPVKGARVRAYSGGRELRERGGPGPVTTLSEGTGFLQFRELPRDFTIKVTGGRAGGKPMRGSLTAEVRGVRDGDLVDVNPITTVADAWENAEEGRSQRRARAVVERTLGIRRIFDDHDLYATDRWFDGDRFHRWTLERGSIGAGARELVEHIDDPGFDRRTFRDSDEGGPNARVAAIPGGSAASFLDGLIDAANSAANLSGPQGFLLGTALLFIKTGIDAGLNPSKETKSAEKEVLEKLDAITQEISDLKGQVDTRFFELQVTETDKTITAIRGAQTSLTDALKRDKEANDTSLTDTERVRARRAYHTAKYEFIEQAKQLSPVGGGGAIAILHQALVREQFAAGVKRAALIPGIREELGKQRFFTNQSSKTIDAFFSYYESAQVALAAVLTEYYTLGGPCVSAAPPTAEGACEKPPAPDGLTAQKRVEEIQANIAKQQDALPTANLDPRFFIDTKNNKEWRVEAQYMRSAELLKDGIERTKCNTPIPVPGTSQKAQTCQANTARKDYLFRDPPVAKFSWRIPTTDEAQNLFKPGLGAPDDPLTRLESLGVRYPSSQRFPGSSGLSRLGDDDLWLRDGFTTTSFAPFNSIKSIDARVLSLASKRAATLSDPKTVAEGCNLATVPSCSKVSDAGRFILWVRDTNRDETSFLW